MYLLYSALLAIGLLISLPYWLLQTLRHGKYRTGLVGELQRRFPQYQVVVSTATDTGQKLAYTRFGEENTFYFPLDFAFAIGPYLRRLRPELIVLAETEFWPNFLRLAHQRGARIAVVNARISDRSWPGYRRIRRLLAKV